MVFPGYLRWRTAGKHWVWTILFVYSSFCIPRNWCPFYGYDVRAGFLALARGPLRPRLRPRRLRSGAAAARLPGGGGAARGEGAAHERWWGGVGVGWGWGGGGVGGGGGWVEVGGMRLCERSFWNCAWTQFVLSEVRAVRGDLQST